jgi:Icc-related predicted phosphoesterase
MGINNKIMKKKITFISDTHNKHKHLTSKGMGNILGSGDILVHAGDCTSMGHKHEIEQFLKWFSNTDFEHKIFIAGNHDFGFEQKTDIDQEFKDLGVTYLFDNDVTIDGIKFYGSPWQPEFHNWAFNLPRGEELAAKWEKIPDDVDILITHGPAYGILDYAPIGGRVGCEELYRKIVEVKPKIHVCGHIHDGYGQKTMGGIEFLNASVLDDRYEHAHKPIVVEYDTETKEITYI